MQVIMEPGQRVPIKAWIDGVELEDAARAQLVKTATMPFLFKHLAVMPDVHSGKGSTIGSVIATSGAIVPAAVGVDLGCGVVAQRTGLRAEDLPDDLHALRLAIEEAIPHGRSDNGGANDRGAWRDGLPEAVHVAAVDSGLADRLARIWDLAGPSFEKRWHAQQVFRQLGTLGTGNHYTEVCLDENGDVWVMLHSGSRGVGNAIGTTFIERAQKHAKTWFIELPDPDLAFLPEGTPDFDAYIEAIGWAQDFAMVNRQVMMTAALGALERSVGRPLALGEAAVNCHHNYVARERHFGRDVLVTRKGAVRARTGDLGIIPGSMGAKSFIVRGKGNRESFESCSHGAGRRMSRTEAKRRFTLEAHAAAVAGVECRTDADVLDETPGAYKSIEAVMAAQAELVDVVHTLRAVVCVKG